MPTANEYNEMMEKFPAMGLELDRLRKEVTLLRDVVKAAGEAHTCVAEDNAYCEKCEQLRVALCALAAWHDLNPPPPEPDLDAEAWELLEEVRGDYFGKTGRGGQIDALLAKRENRDGT